MLGMVLSVLFLVSLLFAIGSEGAASKGEFSPVVYVFGAFVVILCVSAIRTRGASTKLAGTVLGLGLLFVALYTAEWKLPDNRSLSQPAESRSYRISGDDWSVVAGVPLSFAVIALGWSLSRSRD
jgi:hypothetical protein